ncbi:MAG: glycosyl hydrolase [Verrucomicrobia bacterium]|nr:glycosyl hydrolase [Verrucomicrobiota bacterium]
MNHARFKIALLAILVIGIGLAGLVGGRACYLANHRTASVVTSAPAKPRQLQVPQKGLYLGAYLDGGDAEDNVSREAIDVYDKRVGRTQAIIGFSSFWGEQSFPHRQIDLVSGYGAIPLIYWSPWDKPYMQDRGPDRFNLDAIAAGKWDKYIDQWADEAKAEGKPLLVAWGLEMNGIWFPWSGTFYGAGQKAKGRPGHAGPELFKSCYRHVIGRVKARGANNIQWIFHANNYSCPQDFWNMISEYYPGGDVVDWLGMSVYGKQFRGGKWVSFHDCIDYAYQDLGKLDPEKPMILAEIGVGEFPEFGSKAEWVRDALHDLPRDFPRIKGAVFWNERWENKDGSYSNLRMWSSPDSMKAFRHGARDPLWLPRPEWR